VNKKIVHVGLDVDDAHHQGQYLRRTEEAYYFSCGLVLENLTGQFC